MNHYPTAQQIIDAVEADSNLGFCLACGEEAFGVEPDARRYPCVACGQRAVYGAEELLLAGTRALGGTA